MNRNRSEDSNPTIVRVLFIIAPPDVDATKINRIGLSLGGGVSYIIVHLPLFWMLSNSSFMCCITDCWIRTGGLHLAIPIRSWPLSKTHYHKMCEDEM